MRALALIGAAAILAAAVFAGAFMLYARFYPGELDVRSAWHAVQASPRDPAAWAALGDAQAAVDDLRTAEQSYRSALRLGGAEASVHGRLGFLLYGRGQDAEALEMFETAAAAGADLPLLETTMGELRRRRDAVREAAERERERLAAAEAPPPAEPAPRPDLCSVPLRRGGPRDTYKIDVQLNGRPVAMIVDTGASLTAIGATMLGSLGVAIDEEATVTAITATGPAQFPTALIDRLELAGRSVRQLTVAVCNDCGGSGAAGLLGLDAQAALRLELDLKNRRVLFGDCDP